MPTATITTPRLVLRPPRSEDAEWIFERYATDPAVTRFLIWPSHRSIGETRAFIEYYAALGDSGWAYPWVIERVDDEMLLGTIMLRVRPPIAETGFTVARAEWGRGYGTEALAGVADFAFTLPGVYRLQATCHVENGASARIMEKVGMRREGRLQRFAVFPMLGPEPQDAYLYAVTVDDRQRPEERDA